MSKSKSRYRALTNGTSCGCGLVPKHICPSQDDATTCSANPARKAARGRFDDALVRAYQKRHGKTFTSAQLSELERTHLDPTSQAAETQ